MVHHLHQLTSTDYMVCMLPKHRNMSEGEACEGICHYKWCGVGFPENCSTQGSSTESSQENRPIIWSHVNWWMLLSSDLMSLAHHSFWLKQLSKTMGCLTRDPTKTKNQDTIQKESPTSPGASFMKIVLANKIWMYENQNFECKTCMFSMKSLENSVNAKKSMVFQWKNKKNTNFSRFSLKIIAKIVFFCAFGAFCYRKIRF